MVKKLNQQLIREDLKEKGLVTFSPLEFKNIFDVSAPTAQLFIHRQLKKNFFTKFRNGFYALTDDLPNELELANRLCHPSYISFEYGLSFYHLIPESVYAITSATTKATRHFSGLGKEFLYHRLKKELFFGYLAQKINNRLILIATAEKALIDYLYFVYLGKKTLSDRLSVAKISLKILKKYLASYNKDFQKFTMDIYDRYQNHQTTDR